MTTPLELDLLMWVYTHDGEPHPALGDPARVEAYSAAMAKFTFEGIAGIVDGKVVLGERGKIWVAMILDTPMPVSQWIDPRGLTAPIASVAQIASHVASTAAPIALTPAPVAQIEQPTQQPAVQLPPGVTHWKQPNTSKLPTDMKGGQFLEVYRKNGRVEHLYAASVNWRTKGKPDDVIGYREIEEPEGAHKAQAPPGMGRA